MAALGPKITILLKLAQSGLKKYCWRSHLRKKLNKISAEDE
jgi:hypothetical protein